MAHVREQLRQAVYNTISANVDVLALVDFDDITIERVDLFQTLDIHDSGDKQFPAINIIGNEDETDQAFIGNCTKNEVNQEIAVEIYVNRKNQYGASIDEIVVAVQKALFNDVKLGLNITGVKYNGSRMSKDLSETIFAARVLSYTYEYRVAHSDPENFV